ncbi:hypothetical protein, partial [Streptomyces sp. NPDC057199]|uniref:hypothetical protein n=1 Tax=Streptomyces sp. NPDC057199 TaxID=3346047 RepID=UPI003638B218
MESAFTCSSANDPRTITEPESGNASKALTVIHWRPAWRKDDRIVDRNPDSEFIHEKAELDPEMTAHEVRAGRRAGPDVRKGPAEQG